MRKFFFYFVMGICVIIGIHKCVRYLKINWAVDKIMQKFETGDEETRIRYANALMRPSMLHFGRWGIFEEYNVALANGIIDRLKELGCQYKAFEYIESLAQKGDVEQQEFLARMYFCGSGLYPCDRDYEKSFYWYNEAAKRGSEDAIVHLGEAYINGHGVERDAEKGVEMIRSLTELEIHYQKGGRPIKLDCSNAYAQYIYGCLYEKGVEYYSEEKGWITLVPKDTMLARHWWWKAYKNGDRSAEDRLGITDLKIKMSLEEYKRKQRR